MTSRSTRGLASAAGEALGRPEILRVLRQAFDGLALDGRRVLVLIPDGTRSVPMPLLFDALQETLAPRAAAVDYLVALGTHQPMSDAQLAAHLGCDVRAGRAGAVRVFNHRWDLPDTFVSLGHIPAADVRALSRGLMSEDVEVALNRLILDYDRAVVCGPVFPHEVAGFSGGAKYFFPGIAGPQIIDFTHWLGALMTSAGTIGRLDTPVRAVIDRAASFIPVPTTCVSLVVSPGDGDAAPSLVGIFVGSLRDSWRAAAELSDRTHVVHLERPLTRVLSIMPAMYADLWTAAKGMYKLEPAVADGGEIVIYAPHITEVSYTHGRLLDEIGYHCRDYFVAEWERFGGYPGGVLAHATHLKGLGTYNRESGVETSRITVTLATGIPDERCRRLNLGYLDPAAICLEAWDGREADGVLVVRRAGEKLYTTAAATAGGRCA